MFYLSIGGEGCFRSSRSNRFLVRLRSPVSDLFCVDADLSKVITGGFAHLFAPGVFFGETEIDTV